MTGVRPCDRVSVMILRWQDELTSLGLLRDADGYGGDKPLVEAGQKLRPCGTLAAAQRHYRRNEELCPPCKQAIARDVQDRKKKRKQAA